MVLLVHAVVGTLRVHGQAVELTALAHREVADVNHLLNLAQSFLVALAHFVGHEGAEAFFFGPKGIAILTNNLSALGSGPFAPLDEGFCGGVHDALVIVRRCRAERRNALAIDRGVAFNVGP